MKKIHKPIDVLRVALIGAAESVRREISRRLLRATLINQSDDANILQRLNDFDAAIIIAPESCRDVAHKIEQLLVARKHVLLSPDRSVTRELTERFANLANEAQVDFVIRHSHHDLPPMQILKDKFDNLGEVGFVRLHCWQSKVTSTESFRESNTLLYKLEQCCSIIGYAPNLVYAIERPQPSGPNSQYLQVHLGFSGGAMALIDFYGGLPRQQNYHALSIIGSNGAAYVDDHQNMQLLYKDRRPQAIKVDDTTGHWASFVQSFVDKLYDFDRWDSIDNWRKTLQVHEAVLKSLRSGCAVSPWSN
jgi:predicted dehydrogenase